MTYSCGRGGEGPIPTVIFLTQMSKLYSGIYIYLYIFNFGSIVGTFQTKVNSK